MFDRRAEDAVKAALENKIVLRRIFCCLPLSDLKQCRLVKRTWNYEAVSFVKDFRGCICRISEDRPCSDLLALAKIVSGMNLLVPMNGLEIDLGRSSHSDCTSFGDNEHRLYEILLQALPLERLYVSWETAFSPMSCPAVNFLVDLLRRKIWDLSILDFTYLPTEFLNYFGKVWSPWLPKLEVLDIGDTWGSRSTMDFVLRIIDGAPNLKTLKGNGFELEILRIIPEAKYSLLNEFSMYISSDEDERNCLKLAAAEPALAEFNVAVPESHSQYMKSFFHIVEKLLSSSCKTLETFSIHLHLFPLSLLTFPPMTYVRTIEISTDDTAPHLLYILRAIDYPKLFPVLSAVTAGVNVVYDPNDPHTNQWVDDEAAQAVQLNPSTTVKSLDISTALGLLNVVELSQIFPNVVNLKLWGGIGQPTHLAASTLYRDLWASWLELESVTLKEHGGALTWNFDAEFLGINSEELEILRQFDDDSLEKVNLVPIRPSVLTLQRKIKFYIGLCFVKR